MYPTIRRSFEGESVDPALRPLLEAAYETLTSSSAEPSVVKEKRRTQANLVATDQFFVSWYEWPSRADFLPEAYRRVIDDMGGFLHDAISAPEIAANFDSTPEALLARVRRLSD
jgi:hypothetical protein